MAKRTSAAESPALADTGTHEGNLKGKVAFVTGARGQGRAHAVRLASEGADVIAVDLCEQIATVPYSMAIPDDLAATVKLVEDTGARIVAQKADVRDRTSLTAALQAGLDEFGRLDIVVANAGIAPLAARDDGWRDVVDVNLTGVYHTVDVARPTLIGQGTGGAIVLTSSVAGLVAFRRYQWRRDRLHRGQARRSGFDAGVREYPCAASHPRQLDTPVGRPHTDGRQRIHQASSGRHSDRPRQRNAGPDG